MGHSTGSFNICAN